MGTQEHGHTGVRRGGEAWSLPTLKKGDGLRRERSPGWLLPEVENKEGVRRPNALLRHPDDSSPISPDEINGPPEGDGKARSSLLPTPEGESTLLLTSTLAPLQSGAEIDDVLVHLGSSRSLESG
jgi:hypothetical protein